LLDLISDEYNLTLTADTVKIKHGMEHILILLTKIYAYSYQILPTENLVG